MVDGTAVKEITELAERAAGEGVLLTLEDGREVSTRQLHPLPKDHAPDEPAALVVHSLQGLVDYLDANRDQLKAEECMVHVAGPQRVRVVSRLQERAKRFAYLEAEAEDLVDGVLEQWHDLERMNISLQSLFTDAGDRGRVLDTLGNVTADAEVKTTDDGFSQEVTSRKGLKAFTPVPNPVELAPYRTFREVEQPLSPFILRMDKGSLRVALFEADGGAWELEAVTRIHAWLEGKVGGFPILR